MNQYLRGADVLGASQIAPATAPHVTGRTHLAWWERTAIVLGALASIVTVVDAAGRWKSRGRGR